MNTQTAQSASFSIFSILALICAIASFATGAGLGFLLAGLAILFGIIGTAMSLSPRTRGGILSILAIIAGVAGILAAVVKLVWAVTT